MNIMLVGYGRAGKGEFCKIAASLGISSISSSKKACDLGAFDHLVKKHGFPDADSFYPNRHIDRKGCFDAIKALNSKDLSYLGNAIFQDHQIYDGCRNDKELLAIKEAGLIDIIIWIEAGDRIPPEESSSMTITRDMADIVIFNDKEGDDAVKRYHRRVEKLLLCLMPIEPVA